MGDGKSAFSGLSAQSFVRSIFKFSIATWVNALIVGLSTFAASQLLAPEVYGPTNLFLTMSTLVMNVAILGLDQSFIRYYHELPDGVTSRQLCGMCFVLSSGGILLITLGANLLFGGGLSALLFSGIVDRTATWLLFVNAAFLMIARYINIAYRLEGNVRLYTLQSILLQFFSRAFFLVGALFSPSFHSVTTWNVVGMGIFAVCFFLLKRNDLLPARWVFPKALLKKIFAYGLALCPVSVLFYLNSVISLTTVNSALDADSLGIYSIALNLSMLLSVVQGGFATFWSAYIFQNYQREQEKIIRVHDYLTLGTVSLICLISMFQEVLFLFIGRGYSTGAGILPVMLLSPMFLILSETTVYGISIAGRTYIDAVMMAVSVVTNLLLLRWLTAPLGLFGVALALAGSGFLMFALRTAIAQRFYRSMANPYKTFVVVGIAILYTAAASALSSSFIQKGILSIATLGLYLLIYKPQVQKGLVTAKLMLRGFIKSEKA